MITIDIPKVQDKTIVSTTWNILDRAHPETATILKSYPHDTSNKFRKSFPFTPLFNKVVFIQAIRHGETENYPYEPIRIEHKPIRVNRNNAKHYIYANITTNTLNDLHGSITLSLNGTYKHIDVICTNDYDMLTKLSFDNVSTITITNDNLKPIHNIGEKLTFYINGENYVGMTSTTKVVIPGEVVHPLTSNRIYVNPQEEYKATFGTGFVPVKVSVYNDNNVIIYQNTASAVIEANKLEFDAKYIVEYNNNVDSYKYFISTLSSTMNYPLSTEFKYKNNITETSSTMGIIFDTSYSEELMNNYVYVYKNGKMIAIDRLGLQTHEFNLTLINYKDNNHIISIGLDRLAIIYKATNDKTYIHHYNFGTNYNEINLIETIILPTTVRSNVIYSNINDAFYYVNGNMLTMHSIATNSEIEMEPFNNILGDVVLINDLQGDIIITGDSPHSYLYNINDDTITETYSTRTNGYTQFSSVRLDGNLVTIKPDGTNLEYLENDVWKSKNINITNIKSLLRYRDGTFGIVTDGNINGVQGDKSYLYN